LGDDFIVTADGHIVEPADLFKTRLPKHLRDRAVWEEHFEIEPFVEGGYREFLHWHAPGFEGWAISRYRHHDGSLNMGQPERIIEDLEFDGVDAALMHPQTSLFVLYSDDHELSMEHAKVYNDYMIERFLPFKARIRPTCPIPITDVNDAVAEIERVAKAGMGAILLPAIPPQPYHSREYDRLWAAAQANGTNVFFHCATGGTSVNEPESVTLRTVARMSEMCNMPMTPELAVERMMGQSLYSPMIPGQIIIELVGGGVPERFPDLHFGLIEFNAHWLASLMGSMDKAWVTGIGQDADWWLGYWDRGRADHDQPKMARMFRVNDTWPYPLKPTDYIKRQFHISFQDDPAAVACRDFTGVSTLVWGNDYPHAEGTFNSGRGRHSPELIAELFAGVPDADRKAMLGGTLGGILGFERVPAAV
jgi:predicted TIM-barrel fold metal-dependent hydrolase